MNLIKKEYQFIIIVVLFLASYSLDWINGPLKLAIKSPYNFITPEILSQYPFSAVSVVIKIIAVWLSFLLVSSLVSRHYFAKGIVFLLTGFLAQLFSIQQFATGLRVTTAEWTLAIAFGGLVLLATAPLFLVVGIFELIRTKPKTYRIDTESYQPAKSASKDTKKFEFGIDPD